MLQVLHLNVSKVERMLHLPYRLLPRSPQCFFLPTTLIGHPPPPSLLLDAGDVQDGMGPV
jgi:hypothetical protein